MKDSISDVFKTTPTQELALFITQLLATFVVLTVALINISMGWDKDHFWAAAFAGVMGYLLPNPRLPHKSLVPTSQGSIQQ